MVIATGTVHQGTILLHSGNLPEGARVTVLVSEGDETFQLSAADQAKLQEAIIEADRGDVVPASDFLAQLRRL